MKPVGQSCENCGACLHVMVANDVRGMDECHAHSPQIVALPVMVPGQGATLAPSCGWPRVNADHWCAEWRARPVIESANH